MKCKSCKEDVPPKFVHAISVNVCPLCGHGIMDAKLQTILNDLRTVMERTVEFPEETADWLLSNYGLKKWDPKDVVTKESHSELPSLAPPVHIKPQPVQNKPPMLVHRAENEMEAELPAEEVSVFAKRAGLKSSNFKKVIEHIQGAADPSEFRGVDDEYGDVVDEEPSVPLDSRGKKEIMSIFREDDARAIELEKLKKYRAQSAISNNGGGKFWRTS